VTNHLRELSEKDLPRDHRSVIETYYDILARGSSGPGPKPAAATTPATQAAGPAAGE